MIDFNKLMLRTPEERKEAREKLEAKFAAEDARIKLMIDKLYDQYQRDCIGNQFACDFIQSVYGRHKAGIPLTDKQLSKLEELFEKY